MPIEWPGHQLDLAVDDPPPVVLYWPWRKELPDGAMGVLKDIAPLIAAVRRLHLDVVFEMSATDLVKIAVAPFCFGDHREPQPGRVLVEVSKFAGVEPDELVRSLAGVARLALVGPAAPSSETRR